MSTTETKTQTQPQTPQTQFTVACTPWTKTALQQIEECFESKAAASQDIFVSLVKQNEQLEAQKQLRDPVDMTNNHLKAISAWGLTQLKDSHNAYAQREFALFITSLEQAGAHLEKAIRMNKRDPGKPPQTSQAPIQSAPVKTQTQTEAPTPTVAPPQ